MGRHAQSDEQKKAKGTFKPSQSDEARRTVAVSNVLVFPAIPSIPKCSLPIPEDGAGMRAYNSTCQDLLNAGLLTKITLRLAENLALVEHNIESSLLAGKKVTGRDLTVRASVVSKLEMLNVDQNIVAGQTKKGTFGTNGFAGRLRGPSDHRAKRPG